MKKILEKLKIIWSRIVTHVTSKTWWKAQFTMRDWKKLIYLIWFPYGTWLAMQIITYMFYDIPASRYSVSSAYFIALIWFTLYCFNQIWKDSYIKFLREALKASHNMVDRALDGWSDAEERTKKLQDDIEKIIKEK